MTKTISMTAYNRPDYLDQTLQYLTKAIANTGNASAWSIFISIDPSINTAAILDVCSRYKVFYVVNKHRKDHRLNQHDAIQLAFDYGSIFNVHFDDDLMISEDALLLAEYYYSTYQHSPLTFGSYCLFNYNSTPDSPPEKLLLGKSFTGLGWCVFKDNWESIFHPNWMNDDYSIKNFNHFGWDWQMSGYYKEKGISEIYPALSRTNHAGRLHGTCCTTTFYDETFKDLVWNQNYLIKDYTLH